MFINKRFKQTPTAILAFMLIVMLISIHIVSPIILARDINKIKADFSDIGEAKYTWALEYIAYLYDLKVVQGNGKGQFLPTKEVKYNEYLKMLVVALTGKTYTGTPWDKPYVEKAIELGLITNIKDYNIPINRYEMAKLIVLACKEEFKDYEKYSKSLTDSLSPEYREFVLKAYSKGLITGYGSGKGPFTFGGADMMERCQAATVIARLIKADKRSIPVLVTGTPSTPGSNNPSTDFTPDGRLTYAKTVEYEKIIRDSITFYTEKGKYYVKGSYPTLPEGFQSDLSIDVVLKDKYSSEISTSSDTLDEYCIPSTGSFNKVLENLTKTTDIDYLIINISVYQDREPKDENDHLMTATIFIMHDSDDTKACKSYIKDLYTDKYNTKFDYIPYKDLPGLQLLIK